MSVRYRTPADIFLSRGVKRRPPQGIIRNLSTAAGARIFMRLQPLAAHEFTGKRKTRRREPGGPPFQADRPCNPRTCDATPLASPDI